MSILKRTHPSEPAAPRNGPAAEWAVLKRLNTPDKVQAYLDTLAYSADPFYRHPGRVVRDRKANCVDGALLAAAAFRLSGRPPVVMELCACNDDDHYVALFREGARFGAVARSNYSGLRYRPPVYRSCRELAMSYCADYFNTRRQFTLRSRSIPVDLRRFDALNWMTDDGRIEELTLRIEGVRHVTLISATVAATLPRVDARAFQAGLLGAQSAGLYQPGNRRTASGRHS